jgi:16S rRNA (cytosine1402-N4)-methyltransferase
MPPVTDPENSSPETPLPPEPPHRRRPRYSGKNPRRFEEKYKEHQPEKFPETVARVLASGKTPAGSHRPVMVQEVLEALQVRPGQRGVDVTLGYGGHARAILERLRPGGCLLGLDADPEELPRTETRLRELGFGPEELVVLRSNYAGLPRALAEVGWEGADFVLADLGCSSMQLDDPDRGFTFKQEGPLDMRMNPRRGLPASVWLERIRVEELSEVLREGADEPRHAELATELAGRKWESTRDLARAVRIALGPEVMEETGDLTIRRVFQAVRIAVNEEFQALDMFLRVLPGCLRSGGRVVILTFHSGEDRRVKKAFQAGHRAGWYESVSRHVVTASAEERRANPRSGPAKLRCAVRTV